MSKLQKLIDKLCPEGVEYLELGEVCDYEQPTKYIVKNTEYSNEYKTPVLTPGQTFILGYTNEIEGIYNADKNNPVILFDDFTVATKWVDFDFKVKSSAIKILKSNNNNIRYIWHSMQNINYSKSEHSRQWINKYSKIKIPVPPLEVQEEIVRKLDHFDKLVNDITEVLPAEIKMRQDQYKYYLNKLLTCEKLESGK